MEGLICLTEQNRTEQNRTEQNRTEQNRTEQNIEYKPFLSCDKNTKKTYLSCIFCKLKYVFLVWGNFTIKGGDAIDCK